MKNSNLISVKLIDSYRRAFKKGIWPGLKLGITNLLFLVVAFQSYAQLGAWRGDGRLTYNNDGSVRVEGTKTFTSTIGTDHNMLHADFSTLFRGDKRTIEQSRLGGAIADVGEDGEVRIEVSSYSIYDHIGSKIYDTSVQSSTNQFERGSYHEIRIAKPFINPELAIRRSIGIDSDDMAKRIQERNVFAHDNEAGCENFMVRIFNWITSLGQEGFECARTFNPVQPVVVEITVTNATVKAVKIPAVGTFSMRQLTVGQSGDAFITVLGPTGELKKTHYITGNQDCLDVACSNAVSAVAGDKVIFSVVSDTKPRIEGLGAIWPSGFGYSTAFIGCTNRPGHYKPFVPWEMQVHMKLVNTYPKGFDPKWKDWQKSGNLYTLEWVAERRTDPGKQKYLADVDFPNIKTSDNGSKKRDDQVKGYQAQMVHYWKENNQANQYNGIQYLDQWDNDELMYNTKTVHISGLEERVNQTELHDNIDLNPHHVDEPGVDLINWQQIWPHEISHLNEQKTTTHQYDKHTGFPSAGFVLNDYITEYQKYKECAEGNHNYDTYFDGYHLQDHGTWKVNGTTISHDETDTPAVCGDGCLYYPENAAGNNKHPGEIRMNIDGFERKFRLRVEVPLPRDKGFYGSVEGTNRPLAWGNPAPYTYTLTGMAGSTPEERARYSFALLGFKNAGSYNPKSLQTEQIPAVLNKYGGTAHVVKEIKFDENSYNSEAGTWEIEIESFGDAGGQALLVVYYETDHGKVIIAGRDLWLMEPILQHFSAPGSKPYPFSGESLVNNGLDLKEGIGERPGEYVREFRQNLDWIRGHSIGPIGNWFQKRSHKSYVLQKGTRITFSVIDGVLGKIQRFNHGGPFWLFSYRDIAKMMPDDEVAQNLKYTVHRSTPDGVPLSQYHDETGRHFDYTWNEPGDWLLSTNFMGCNFGGFAKVTVVDYPEHAGAVGHLGQELKRGKIRTYGLTDEIKGWLKQANPAADLTNLRVAEVTDVLSEFQYISGARATSYGNRFGSFRDYYNEYRWKKKADGTYEDYDHLDQHFLRSWYENFDPQEFWPVSWNNWLRHASGLCCPPNENFTDVNENQINNGPESGTYQQLMQTAFNSLSHQNLGFERWLPWVMPTPTEGYKFGKFVKPIMDLNHFFNTTKAWSGEPTYTPPQIQNFIWDQGILTDDIQNQLEFYEDLRWGRKIIFNGNDIHDLKVYQVNPRLHADDVGKLNEIYIDHWNYRDLISNVFRASYDFYAGLRQFNGTYLDAQVFGKPNHYPASLQTTGIGLISICIAHQMGWITSEEAKTQIKQTLSTMASIPDDFQLDKSDSGFGRHFFAPYNDWYGVARGGERAWNSEYSVLDQTLFLCGALFAKKYLTANVTEFGNVNAINQLVNQLWSNVHWDVIFPDPAHYRPGGEGYQEGEEHLDLRGALYYQVNASGEGEHGRLTWAPNEYFLVAYFAKVAEDKKRDAGLEVSNKANEFWNQVYNQPEQAITQGVLHSQDYGGYTLFQDPYGNFLSEFIPQFRYYFNHGVSTSEYWMGKMRDAMNADKAWFQDQAESAAPFEWGLGAGNSDVNEHGGQGYHADKVNENVSLTVSPHIQAGYLPILSPQERNTILLNLYKILNKGRSELWLPGTLDPILWRYNLANDWRSYEVSGVDFSGMLFGLASLPRHCGLDFFPTYNNYDFPDYSEPNARVAQHSRKIEEEEIPQWSWEDDLNEERLLLYPNPNDGQFTMEFAIDSPGVFQGQLVDLSGRLVMKGTWEFTEPGTHQVHLAGLKEDGGSKVYVLRVMGEGMRKTLRVVIK